MDKKLFLLDGMALIYRAHFALSKNPRFTSKGVNTGAIMGFTNTLLEILNKEKPSHIAVVFDTDTPTERHAAFEHYKAHREAMPEDLARAVPYIFDVIRGFNIPVVTVEGYEADDIIGTLAKQAEKEGFTVYCMTPDKDFAQLVSPNIFLYKPARMGNGVEIMGVPEVLAKWEIERVEQVIDILGLWGDAVDNIPGIPGIGEKTAKLLIKKYGSVEEIIANAHELKGKQQENVRCFAEQGLLSKQLATILLNVPVTFCTDEYCYTAPSRELLEPLFAELEFRTLGRRVFGDGYSVNMPGHTVQGDLFSSPAAQAQQNAETATVPLVKSKLADSTYDYKLADTPEAHQALMQELMQQPRVSFDTETTGIDAHSAELVGISFSWKQGTGYYVPLPAEREKALDILEKFKPFYESEAIEKVGQNTKYDIIVLANYGVQVCGKLFDTMIAHYLIDPDTRHNMDVLAENYLNYTPISITELIGPPGKKQGNMRQVPVERVKDYAVEDADVTLQLADVFKEQLEQINAVALADDIEYPLINVLARMERTGVKIDSDVLREYSAELEREMQHYERVVYEKAGVQFNISSPRQLGEVLFDKLQLDPKAKKTKTGQYQTGEDVLTALAGKSDIVKDILEYRQLQKLKSTYVDALPLLVNSNTGRLHTSYNQAVASTGRLSSNNPNLQNIPIKTERGREVRKAFIPASDEHLIISADYSQIELRIIADIAKEENMLDAFNKAIDIHTATAARVYNVALDEVTPTQRRNAKAVNFGIIYGQSAFGLSQTLGIPRGEAAEIIAQYFEQYPGIRRYMSDTMNFARENGYVETLMKRRRYLRDINSHNATVRGFAERNAINAPIQGSAADMIKIAMINIDREMVKRGMGSRMTMQVHDELVFDALRTEKDELKDLVAHHMVNALKTTVPVVVEIGEGSNWLEAH